MKLLHEPIKIKNVEISNRLVMPPMATAQSNEDGTVSQCLIDYYDKKSKGGYIGLIILEHSYVSLEGKVSHGQMSISQEKDIEGLKKVVQAIHRNHTKVFAQINHGGSKSRREITGCDSLAPSAVFAPNSKNNELPEEMSYEDIQQVILAFQKAAFRAKQAGFDGVEIHGAHGYLLSQFFSPLTNHRTDEYNGSTLKGRIKIYLDIIHAVRKVVGDDYPIALRLGACDYMEGGIVIEDSVSAACEFEKAGVDLLDISGGFCGADNPHSKKPGYFSELSEAIQKVVHIPLILTGGIVDAQSAEDLLASHKADMIGVGRAILKDSHWAKEAMSK